MLNPFNRFFFVLAYLGVLYIRPHEFAAAWAGLPVLPVLLGTAFALWLIWQPKNFESSLFWLMPLLLAMLSLSLLFTGWAGGAYKAFTDFGPVVLLFALLATSVDSMHRLRQVFFVLVVATTVIAVHGYLQWSDNSGWTDAAMVQGRITYLGFLNDPNDLSMALLMTLPMFAFMAGEAGFLARWAYRAAAALVLFAVYLSNSRGATLALGGMLLTYGIWRYGFWRSLFVVPLLLAPLFILAPSRMSEMAADEESAEGRIEAWYRGFELLRQHPLFGVGKGNFTDYNPLTAHNSYVLSLAETGLFGYFVWFSILVIGWIMLRRVEVLKPERTDTSPAALEWARTHRASRALWVGYVGLLIAAFFLSRSYVVILYVQLALIVAVFQLARTQRPELEPVRFAPLLRYLVVGCLASVVLLWLLTRLLLAFSK